MKYLRFGTLDMLAIVSRMLLFAIIALIVICGTSCTLTIDADGAKSFSVDGAQTVRALEILSQK